MAGVTAPPCSPKYVFPKLNEVGTDEERNIPNRKRLLPISMTMSQSLEAKRGTLFYGPRYSGSGVGAFAKNVKFPVRCLLYEQIKIDADVDFRIQPSSFFLMLGDACGDLDQRIRVKEVFELCLLNKLIQGASHRVAVRDYLIRAQAAAYLTFDLIWICKPDRALQKLFVYLPG